MSEQALAPVINLAARRAAKEREAEFDRACDEWSHRLGIPTWDQIHPRRRTPSTRRRRHARTR